MHEKGTTPHTKIRHTLTVNGLDCRYVVEKYPAISLVVYKKTIGGSRTLRVEEQIVDGKVIDRKVSGFTDEQEHWTLVESSDPWPNEEMSGQEIERFNKDWEELWTPKFATTTKETRDVSKLHRISPIKDKADAEQISTNTECLPEGNQTTMTLLQEITLPFKGFKKKIFPSQRGIRLVVKRLRSHCPL